MGDYSIPAQTIQTEQLIKKSRFIAFMAHAPNPEAAHAFIASVRTQYPDAGHACWAFIAGEPGNTTHISCSDDGEPAGTAGKPMLNVLQHSDIGEIVAVVVRYFGGVKLGTGGLVRAYSGAVTELIKTLPIQLKIDTIVLTLNYPYALEDVVRRTLEAYATLVDEVSYAQDIKMCCLCPADQLAALTQQLNDAGRGQIHISSD